MRNLLAFRGPVAYNAVMAELEERQAKIEGILEQIDKRLTRVESEVEGLRTEIRNLHAKIDSEVGGLRTEIGNLHSKVDSEIKGLRVELTSKMDSNFKWQMGVMFTMWVTIILAVLVKG